MSKKSRKKSAKKTRPAPSKAKQSKSVRKKSTGKKTVTRTTTATRQTDVDRCLANMTGPSRNRTNSGMLSDREAVRRASARQPLTPPTIAHRHNLTFAVLDELRARLHRAFRSIREWLDRALQKCRSHQEDRS